MEMTQQRVRESLIHTFAEPCPTCNGVGMVQGRDTTITKIERWFKRAEVFGNEKEYTIFLNPSVYEFLIENDEERLNMLKSSTGIEMDIVVDSKRGIDEFVIFSTKQGKDVTKDFVPGKKNPEPAKTAVVRENIKFGRKPRMIVKK
jgi:Ribonuclease G/E